MVSQYHTQSIDLIISIADYIILCEINLQVKFRHMKLQTVTPKMLQ